MKFGSIALKFSLIAAAAALVACSDNTDTLSLDGSGVKGPVSGATVKVLKASTGAAISGASCTNTDDNGDYSCEIPSGAVGPFKIVLEGGKYCPDERKVSECGAGSATTLATPLSTIALASGSTLANAPITPFTTAAVQKTEATGDATTFLSAYATVANALGIDTNPTVTPVASGSNRTALLLKEIAGATDLGAVVDALEEKTGSAPVSGDLSIGDLSIPVASLGTAEQPTSTANLTVVTQITGTGASGANASGSNGL